MDNKPTYNDLLNEIELLKNKLHEKRNLEKELEKVQILMQAAFDQSPVPMVVATYPDFTFKIINKATEKFLLVNASNYLNKPPLEVEWCWQEYLPDGSKVTDAADLPLPRALQGIYTVNKEMRIERKDGSSVWELASASPIYDNEGNLIAGILAMVDITERKETEKILEQQKVQLKEQNEEYEAINEELTQTNHELLNAKLIIEKSEERFRLMVKNSNDSFVLLNRDGEQFYISDAAARDTGFSIEELKGPIHNVIVPDDWETVSQAWNKVVNTKDEIVRVQYRHKHKFKDYIWFEAVAQNYLDVPDINAVVVNVRDITAIKDTESALVKAKERAEESDRLKTAFLQNMSHEIRTPMNAIMGFSSLLDENLNDQEKLLQFSKIIKQRCADLLDIINDILDISKIESGQNTVNIEMCNINELFSELNVFFRDYQNRINKQHIEFFMQPLADESYAVVMTDRVKLRQILINLISNAFKFTEAGSVNCGCKKENNKLYFYVSDTGVGIPEDKYGYVFERFTQLNHPLVQNTGGTGLGLPIVKGLAGLLGGEVWFESESNKGTTFFLSIDYASGGETVKAAHSGVKTDSPIKNKSVLIVEDDIYNSMYLQEILKKYVTNVHTVNSGADAIKFARNITVDIVLMDVRLPDISGYEATKEILKENPTIKIIAQTAYAANDEYQKALSYGCVGYISKPTKQEQLVNILNKYLK